MGKVLADQNLGIRIKVTSVKFMYLLVVKFCGKASLVTLNVQTMLILNCKGTICEEKLICWDRDNCSGLKLNCVKQPGEHRILQPVHIHNTIADEPF